MAAETVSLLIKLLADSAKFTKTLDDAQKQAQKTTKEIVTTFKDMSGKIAVGATAFGGAIVGGFGLAAKAAADFDSDFAKVTTLLEKEHQTPAFIQQLKDGIFEVGKEFGTTIPDNIDAMQNALSSGVPPDNVIQFMKDSAMAAKAGVAELGSVVDVTTSIMAAYNMKADDATKINDILFAAVKVGKIEYSDFAQYLGQVLPIASAAGVSLEEVSGAIAALTLSGFKPAQAVESLRSMLANVIKPSEDAKKAAEALGVEFNVAALKTKGLQGFMNDLFAAMKTKVDWKLVDESKVDSANKKLKTLKEQVEKVNAEMADPKNAKKQPALQKKLEVLQKKTQEVEGELVNLHTTAAEALDRETGAAKMFGDVSGLAAALALGNNEAKAFNESMDATKNATGSAAEAFQAYSANDPKIVFQQLSVTVQELIVNIGRLVMEALAPLAGAFLKVATHVTDWVKNNPELTKWIVYATGAIGLLALAIGGVAAAASFAAGMYLTLTAAQATLAGGFALTAGSGAAAAAGTTAAGAGAAVGSTGFWALAAGVWAALAPILLVVAIVVAVVAALVLLYYGLKKLAESKYGQAFFDGLVAIWDGLVAGVTAAWDAIVSFFSKVISFIGGVIVSVGKVLYGIGSIIVGTIMVIFQGIFAVLAAIFGPLLPYVVAAWDAIVAAITAAGTAIYNVMKSAWDAVVSALTTAWTYIAEAFAAGFNALVEFFTPAWELVAGIFTAALTKIQLTIIAWWTYITAVCNTFVAGVAALWQKIADKAAEVWEAIKAPFVAVIDFLVGIWNRFWEGLQSGWDAAMKGPEAFAEWLKTSIKNAVDACLGFLKDLWEKAKNLPGAIWDNIKGTFGGGEGGGESVPGFATGGVVSRKTLAYVGEAGPEAIIPLAGGGVPVRFLPSSPVGSGSTSDEKGGGDTFIINTYPQRGQSEEQIANATARVVARRKGRI